MYVRRMRPTFGYIMAVTWAAQMLAIAFVILDAPEKAGNVINAMSNLSTIWTVGLSVLGIYVYKRSREKIAGVNGD
jgi:cobalamin synthase